MEFSTDELVLLIHNSHCLEYEFGGGFSETEKSLIRKAFEKLEERDQLLILESELYKKTIIPVLYGL